MTVTQVPVATDRIHAGGPGMQMPVDGHWHAATDPAEASRLVADAAAASRVLETAAAGEIVEWAAASIPEFVVTSSFGIDASVLLHLVARHAPGTPVIFLDTGLHFPETIAYRDTLTELFDLNVVTVRSPLAVEDQARLFGRRLFARDAETCCMLRKGLPLQAALSRADGWASGVRRSQTASRADTPIVGTARKADRLLLKVAPLATWTDDDMAAHRRNHELPEHVLEARGYRSVGCEPCTRPTAPDEDPRAGRWAHEPEKTECGIHIDPDLGVVRTSA